MNAMKLQRNRSVIRKEWTSIWEQQVQQIKCAPRLKVSCLWETKCSSCLLDSGGIRLSATKNTALYFGLDCDTRGSSCKTFYVSSSVCVQTYTFSHTNNSLHIVLRLQSKHQAPDLRPLGVHVASKSLNMPFWERSRVSDWRPDSKRQRDWQESKSY